MCQVLCWVLEIQKYIQTDGTNHTIECKSTVEERCCRWERGLDQCWAIREGFPEEEGHAREGQSAE